MRSWTVLGLLAVTMLMGTGCGGSKRVASHTGATRGAGNSGAGQIFDLDATAVADGQSVRVVGTSNLPEGSNITVLLMRGNHLSSDSDIHATDVGGGAMPVRGGQFSGSFPLDEQQLVSLHPTSLGDLVTACLQFRTNPGSIGDPAAQDAAVTRVVGERGSRLKESPHLRVMGSATDAPQNWIEIHRSVELLSPYFGRKIPYFHETENDVFCTA